MIRLEREICSAENDKFGDGVFLALAAHGLGDFVVLDKGQKKLHKLATVGRVDGVQNFSNEMSKKRGNEMLGNCDVTSQD